MGWTALGGLSFGHPLGKTLALWKKCVIGNLFVPSVLFCGKSTAVSRLNEVWNKNH
jgi:hypothetical protein